MEVLGTRAYLAHGRATGHAYRAWWAMCDSEGSGTTADDGWVCCDGIGLGRYVNNELQRGQERAMSFLAVGELALVLGLDLLPYPLLPPARS